MRALGRAITLLVCRVNYLVATAIEPFRSLRRAERLITLLGFGFPAFSTSPSGVTFRQNALGFQVYGWLVLRELS